MRTKAVSFSGVVLIAEKTFSFGCGCCHFRNGRFCILGKEDTPTQFNCVEWKRDGYSAYHWKVAFAEDDRK